MYKQGDKLTVAKKMTFHFGKSFNVGEVVVLDSVEDNKYFYCKAEGDNQLYPFTIDDVNPVELNDDTVWYYTQKHNTQKYLIYSKTMGFVSLAPDTMDCEGHIHHPDYYFRCNLNEMEATRFNLDVAYKIGLYLMKKYNTTVSVMKVCYTPIIEDVCEVEKKLQKLD